MSDPVRLAKRVIELTGCSRSEADQYIEGGWVKVDGTVVEEPQLRVLDEKIEIDPNAKLTASEPATLLFHKPAGQTSEETLASLDPSTRWVDDSSGIRTLKRHRTRLVEVYPLDDIASGLVVFTQDRRVSNRADEDGHRIEQELIAEVSGALPRGGLRRLESGLSYDGRVLPPSKVSWQNETKLRFALKAPRPGQIAHMCREVGLELVSLKRIRIGRVPLAKMPQGAWRYLPTKELFLPRART